MKRMKFIMEGVENLVYNPYGHVINFWSQATNWKEIIGSDVTLQIAHNELIGYNDIAFTGKIYTELLCRCNRALEDLRGPLED